MVFDVEEHMRRAKAAKKLNERSPRIRPHRDRDETIRLFTIQMVIKKAQDMTLQATGSVQRTTIITGTVMYTVNPLVVTTWSAFFKWPA